MRATVTDHAALLAVSPLNVVSYLRARGWLKYSEVSNRFSVWHRQDAEIVIPFSSEVRDYPVQVSLALRELEKVEGRSQLEILRDFIQAGYDVIRLAASSPTSADGTVKVLEGVRLFERAKDILLAAACAAAGPRAVFHSRKPEPAVQYMRRSARLGQTEHGSYVLTLLSPVAPQLQQHADGTLFPEEPFERRVVETLAKSVEAAVWAARKAATDADFGSFLEVIDGGVSANLCEGLVGLFETTESTAVDLSVTWALNRPAPNAVPSRVRIRHDVIPALQEAAYLLRANDFHDAVVEGPIVKLERGEYEEVGRATIYARLDEGMRRVVVDLSALEYQAATQAHGSFQQVQAIGRIRKEGRAYRMREPLSFSTRADDNGDNDIETII